MVEFYEKRAKSIIIHETIPQHASEFHMCYFWQDHINYSIVNPEVDAAWQPPLSSFDTPSQKMGIKAKLRLSILNLMRIWFSQGRRNAKLDILPLMRCPKCNSENLERLSATEIACKGCDAPYKIDRNIFQIH